MKDSFPLQLKCEALTLDTNTSLTFQFTTKKFNMIYKKAPIKKKRILINDHQLKTINGK